MGLYNEYYPLYYKPMMTQMEIENAASYVAVTLFVGLVIIMMIVQAYKGFTQYPWPEWARRKRNHKR